MTDRVSSLSCLQINLRRCRAAALSLSQFILDSGFDIILIQKPYATFNNGIELKYIPPGYVCFHNLTKDHAYGAAVFAKTSLKASPYPWGVTNSIKGIRDKIKHKEVFFSPSISVLVFPSPLLYLIVCYQNCALILYTQSSVLTPTPKTNSGIAQVQTPKVWT